MAKITDIRQQKKDTERVSVYLDGEYAFSLNKEILLKHRLCKGQEIEREKMKPVILESENKTAFLKGLSAVSKKLCSEHMVKEKLKAKGFSENAVSHAVRKLKEYRYLDDREYAKAYAACYGGQKGRLKIAYELKGKGILPEIIDELENDVEKELSACKAAALKFIKGKSKDGSLKQKLYRHLFYKGFDSETAQSAIKDVLIGGEEINDDYQDT